MGWNHQLDMICIETYIHIVQYIFALVTYSNLQTHLLCVAVVAVSKSQEALELEFLARLQLQLGQFKEGRKSGEEALKILIGAGLEDVPFWGKGGGCGSLSSCVFFVSAWKWIVVNRCFEAYVDGSYNIHMYIYIYVH